MSFTVSELAGSLDAGSITVRGFERPARPVFAREALRLEESLPRPIAPLKLDPDKGVKAPMIRDYENAAFLAASDRRSLALTCGWIAVSLGLADDAGKKWSIDMAIDESSAWLKANADRLASAFSTEEIEKMARDVQSLGTPMVKQAERIGTDEAAGN